jgi:hypothetical protein
MMIRRDNYLRGMAVKVLPLSRGENPAACVWWRWRILRIPSVGSQGEASVSCWSFYSRSFSLAAGVFDIPRRISSFRQGFGRAWDDVPAQTTCLPFGAIGETNSAFSNEVGTCLVRWILWPQ